VGALYAESTRDAPISSFSCAALAQTVLWAQRAFRGASAERLPETLPANFQRMLGPVLLLHAPLSLPQQLRAALGSTRSMTLRLDKETFEGWSVLAIGFM